MFRCGEFGGQPGRVLEDAFRTGIVDKLFAADKALFHRDSAPGAESVGEVRHGGIKGRRHDRHCLRGLQTLSTDRGYKASAEKYSCRRPYASKKSWYSAFNNQLVLVSLTLL